MNSICFVFFCFEFALASFGKSRVLSFYPLSYSGKHSFPLSLSVGWFLVVSTGYLFNFFWFLDLASIVSMFPDVPWIANPIGIGSISNGGVTGTLRPTVGCLRVLMLIVCGAQAILI
jgi:hypothetical protein